MNLQVGDWNLQAKGYSISSMVIVTTHTNLDGHACVGELYYMIGA